MKSPKAPAAPDPVVTAGAQTGTNVATAVANANLQNVNQVTPYGNLTYSQSGTNSFTDPTTGKTFDIPSYTATQTLSDSQGRIEHLNNLSSENLARTGAEQSAFLGNYLGKGMDTSGLPARSSSIAGAGPIQTSVANAGPIQNSIANAGAIQRDLGNTAGSIQYGFGDAGAITKSYGTDFSEDRKRTEDAMYERLNPQIDRQRAAEETRLQNQGVRIGSTAWQSAMEDLNRGLNDQRTSIVLAGGQEQSRMVGLEANRAAFQNSAQNQNFGQMLSRTQVNNAAQQQDFGQILDRGNFSNAAQQQQYGQNANDAAFANSAQQQRYGQNLSDAGFANQAQQQQFGQNAAQTQAQNSARDSGLQELFALRNQPINEISSLMQGAQVQQPQFQNTNMPSIPTVDYAGLVQQNYANQNAAYQQAQAQRQSTLGGLFGLGASVIGMSDRRLKTDVETVGTGPLGLPVYAFRYVWGGPRQIGFMAQDVLRVLPEAVLRMANGFLAVDYGRIFAKGAA